MAVAKGITGGYLPLAATLATEEIYEAFKGEYAELKAFFHGHTYTGNPLACAAAIASIDLFDSENTIGRLQGKIDQLTKRLEIFKAHPHVGDVRQAGFMVGIELMQDKENAIGYPIELRAGHRVILDARKRGIIIRPLGNVVVLMPPLSISADELEILLNTVYESIDTISKSLEEV
jgi:adenosylmethionine-8-amino-7-oxononanoate aminotransferase